jgi:hypothetical protein
MKSSTDQSFKSKTNHQIGGCEMALIKLIMAYYTACLLEITDHVIKSISEKNYNFTFSQLPRQYLHMHKLLTSFLGLI